MNYKDAVTAPISSKLTKEKLISLCVTLQDHCLLQEIDKPELIPLKSYIKDVTSRMDIHHYEMRELNKDVRNVWTYVKDKVNTLSIT